MDIGYFLKLMTEKNASDMFLTTGAPVYIKIGGKLYPLGNTGLPPGMVKKIAYSLMDEGQVPQFERDLELNMALSLQDSGRFRVNVFKQRGEVGMVIRAIKSEIPNLDELKLPQVLECHLVSGDFDYLIKARISEMASYRKLLGDILLKLPHVRESKSYIVMEELKETLQLPVPG